jgi:hypothetical protein
LTVARRHAVAPLMHVLDALDPAKIIARSAASGAAASPRAR